MPASALRDRYLAGAREELRRLRDSLRPASVSAQPSPHPMDSVWSADDRLLHLSANVERHLGWDPAYLLRVAPAHWLYRPGDVERVYPPFYRCLMGSPARGVEHRLLHSDRTGYVWLSDDMSPGRRDKEGRVLEVHIRTHDLTAIRAREVEFILECLQLFDPRRHADELAELGVPALLANLLPQPHERPGARIIPFRFRVDPEPLPPGMEPALSSDFTRSHRRRQR